MQVNKKIIFSILLLVIAGGIASFVILRAKKIPKFSDYVEAATDKYVIEKDYSYIYDAEYPVSVQKIFLTSGFTNIVGISSKEGENLSFEVVNTRELIVFFEKPVYTGEMVNLKVKAEVYESSPFLNIVDHKNGLYSLHFVSWERNLAKKLKKVVLPDSAVVKKVYTTVADYKITDNAVVYKWVFNGMQIFDISIDFTMDGGEMIAFPASMPIILGNQVKFRIPKSLSPQPPLIRGDFSLWRDLPMVEEGDFYVLNIKLPAGVYRYQFRYGLLVTADPSVPERAYNNFGESYSQIKIQ
ncbi:MAG: hypothetical protein HPY53_08385 [Brevinematales bacterium]|nr:hypothetical protein [Brevinematales bacterium]